MNEWDNEPQAETVCGYCGCSDAQVVHIGEYKKGDESINISVECNICNKVSNLSIDSNLNVRNSFNDDTDYE